MVVRKLRSPMDLRRTQQLLGVTVDSDVEALSFFVLVGFCHGVFGDQSSEL